jgi:hypothetical protein
MIKKLLTVACSALMMTSTPAYGADHTDGIAGEAWTYRKGMRFGYNYSNKAEESDRLASPHMFGMGFEMQQTMTGGDWLDLLFIQNIMISGVEQSVIIPTVNALVGFEINKSLQVGVGINGSIYDSSGNDNFIHLISAIGWTQEAGTFSVPIHFVYVPDINGYYRFAVTTGVNW